MCIEASVLSDSGGLMDECADLNSVLILKERDIVVLEGVKSHREIFQPQISPRSARDSVALSMTVLGRSDWEWTKGL